MSRNPENKRRAPIPIPEPAPLPEPETIDVESIAREYAAGDIDLIVVLGPTASGKTRYAVGLAHQLNSIFGNQPDAERGRYLPEHPNEEQCSKREAQGPEAGDLGNISLRRGSRRGARSCEILSADSRQVYRGMDIGTGKDLEEYGDVPCHLIDIVPAGTRFDLFQWQQAFEAACKDIVSRGNIPILCGGTGLYVQAATCGYRLPQVPPNDALRTELELLGPEELIAKLAEFGPLPGEGVLQSKRRIIRALEVASYEKEHPVIRSHSMPRKPFYIGTLVSRETRIERIDRRLDERLRNGLVEEVRNLLASGIAAEDLVYYGLEYKFVTQHVLGILSYDEMRTLLANAIHQFAKRQMTWFRGMEKNGIHIHWTKP